MTSQAPLRQRLLGLAADVGNVLFAWTLCLVADYLLVELAHGDMVAAAWEQRFARRLVLPTALGALLPVACLAVAGGRLAALAARDVRARGFAAALLAVASGAVAFGVSFGRHMAAWSIRGPFVAGLAAVGAAVGWWVLPPLVRALRDWRLAALVGVGATAALWSADSFVLPRLYPAFHAALLALLLTSAAVGSLVWNPREETPTYPSGRGARWLGVITLVLAGIALARVPVASEQLRGADNLRLILVEHAPLLGRAVRLAAVLAPPPPLDDEDPSKTSLSFAVGEIPRALDWTGHDVLLISVDALRADHSSAYGYGRATTPSIDALATEGALFDSAYCPTPHTSYSITSMMTGKAMRPLLALGVGRDSETWAGALRRYGFRTAAFYPPAVFFIDQPRFQSYEASGLDFEYRKVEFAPAARRVGQVEDYLNSAPKVPLFLWVHLFEPHEPYEPHDDHPFGPLPVDAYDSEIAEADAAIGRIVSLFRQQRPGAVVLVTADHGEEFGEHGGHYHGTSCYEEQVHVPLVVVGPGVVHQRLRTVVQTIDLLPTTLSALGIPRPARIRGRDLGPVLAKRAEDASDGGLAYAETDDYTMVARSDDRLVCARKIGACALYDIRRDPGEQHDRGAEAPATMSELRHLTAALERDQGRYEGQREWPEALRRGLQGEVDAAEDVSTLLDDAQVTIRRKAAEVLFRLHVQAVAPSVARALGRDEDGEVRSWCALALVRMGELPSASAAALVHDPDQAWRRRAALAFAERGDARGGEELAVWWTDEAPPSQGLDVEAAKELLAGIERSRDTAAVPGLLASLAFVPLRPWVADALGAIGDERARAPLLAALEEERYVNARAPEVRALLRLEARTGLREPLARFAGLPEPMTEAISFARDARVLAPDGGGIALAAPSTHVAATLRVPVGPALRLLVLAAQPGPLTGSAAGHPLGADQVVGAVHVLELGRADVPSLSVDLDAPAGLLAAWVVARVAELPPPAPVPFDGGLPDNDNGGRPDPHN